MQTPNCRNSSGRFSLQLDSRLTDAAKHLATARDEWSDSSRRCETVVFADYM